MERCKITLFDQHFRWQVVCVALLLLAALIAGELTVFFMSGDYKTDRIEHDNEIAGTLLRHGVDSGIIASAFTVEKTAADRETGASLLASSGYDQQVKSSLLPEVWHFQNKYMMFTLGIVILFSAAILTALFSAETRRSRQLEAAADQLRRLMEGDAAVRLSDCGEGSLQRLFAMINTMATSLTAHAEKEKQNKEFLKDTISDISHQLKTPLAALFMYNEIICEENTGSEVIEDFSAKSSRELNRMESLIQSLLKLARLDAGAIILEKNLHSVGCFLEEVVSSFVARAELEGKTIGVHCNPSIQMTFDEIWLSEAIGNILKNALDHTQNGDRIDISCTETTVATEIMIQDSGAGIHPEDIHHIFKRFYRSRYSKDKQGVGIGLALAKMIVEKHGGTITVRSELGHGAQFSVIFSKLTNL